MSSANPPPPSYNEAATSPGSSRPPPGQGSNTLYRPPTPAADQLYYGRFWGTASYVRPFGQATYLVRDQGPYYRAYGQPGSAYVVVSGQPASVVTIQDPGYVTTATTTTVILPTGNCPVCGIGNIVESFNIGLVLLAIFCFPFGLICCLLFTEHRCTHCHNTFA